MGAATTGSAPGPSALTVDSSERELARRLPRAATVSPQCEGLDEGVVRNVLRLHAREGPPGLVGLDLVLDGHVRAPASGVLVGEHAAELAGDLGPDLLQP